MDENRLTIICACGQRGTYHPVWVQSGFKVFSEEYVLIWHDPKVEKVSDLRVSVQKNTGRPVYRCLTCAFNNQKQNEEQERKWAEERIARKQSKKPSLFTRLFRKERS